MNCLKLNYWIIFLCFAILLPSRIIAQVLVHEEPLHRPVFQNELIRILDVHLPPGDTTQYHIHHTPSVFIYFTGTTVESQLQGGSPVTSTSTAGNIFFEDLGSPHLRIHRVWNIDQDTLHVMDVELLSQPPGAFQKPLNLRGVQLLVDTAWVRVYRLTLLEKNKFKLKNNGRALVLISMHGSSIRIKQGGKARKQMMEPGKFIELTSFDIFSIQDLESGPAQFALLEMPR